MTSARKRVIVGVTGSLTNLRALRQAAQNAREQDAALFAVHVWESDNNHESVLATARKPGVIACLRRVEQAFDEALGGRPLDLDTRIVIVEGQPQTRLPGLAGRDSDLLVIGTDNRAWWRRVTPSVSARCVRRARCPILVVPPTEMARQALPRRILGRDSLSSHFRTVS